MRLFFLLSFLSPPIAWCQKPVIISVVNAASYQPMSSNSGGSIVSVFGTNLAADTETTSGAPLPTLIGGTSVTVSGLPAHLIYVSPGQINLQVPTRSSYPAIPPPIVVTTAAGISDPYVPTDRVPFGIFTGDSGGCGQGAVLNVNANGSTSVNSPSNSVSPGDYISIFGTGLFAPSYTPGLPTDGTPAPFSPPVTILEIGPSTLFDFLYMPAFPDLFWVGLAPGLVGVDQINVRVPANVREGCAVPLQALQFAGSSSQPVTISIRKGGGACVDPPSAAFGQITWEKAITTAASGSTNETDTMTVSLQASPGKQAPPPPVAAVSSFINQYLFFGPSCPIPGYRSLDAGGIAAKGPGFGPIQAAVISIPPSQISALSDGIYLQHGLAMGLTVYQASLPAGAIQPGPFGVTAAGATDVGAFQSSVDIGSGIQVTTPVAGKAFPSNKPLTINWTGGDPNAWVTFRLVGHEGSLDRITVVQTHASDHTVTLGLVGPTTIASHPFLPGPYDPNMDIVLEVTPEPSAIPEFSAPGVSLGGRHTWKYTYRFEGVTIQ